MPRAWPPPWGRPPLPFSDGAQMVLCCPIDEELSTTPFDRQSIDVCDARSNVTTEKPSQSHLSVTHVVTPLTSHLDGGSMTRGPHVRQVQTFDRFYCFLCSHLTRLSHCQVKSDKQTVRLPHGDVKSIHPPSSRALPFKVTMP